MGFSITEVLKNLPALLLTPIEILKQRIAQLERFQRDHPAHAPVRLDELLLRSDTNSNSDAFSTLLNWKIRTGKAKTNKDLAPNVEGGAQIVSFKETSAVEGHQSDKSVKSLQGSSSSSELPTPHNLGRKNQIKLEPEKISGKPNKLKKSVLMRDLSLRRSQSDNLRSNEGTIVADAVNTEKV